MRGASCGAAWKLRTDDFVVQLECADESSLALHLCFIPRGSSDLVFQGHSRPDLVFQKTRTYPVFMAIPCFHGHSLDLHGLHGHSLDLHGLHGHSLDLHGLHGHSLDLHGLHGHTGFSRCSDLQSRSCLLVCFIFLLCNQP